jgi:hypothetical protein
MARGDERTDQQTAIGLDADDRICGLLGVLGDECVQLGDSLDPLRDPSLGENLTLTIHDADVVVLLGPVDPDEDQHPSSRRDGNGISLEEIGGDLMDQCSSRHHIPRALVSPPLPEGARSRLRARGPGRHGAHPPAG